MEKILLVEDDFDVAGNIQDYLERCGYAVTYASNGALGLNHALGENFDAVILDVRMPGIDGLTVCQQLREKLNVDWPILMLTAADALPDRLKGFDAGADDYVVKPFALEELSARLKVLIRRSRSRAPSKTMTLGELLLDFGQRAAFRENRRLDLTNIGFRILKILCDRSPDIVERETIESEVWGDELPDSDALRSHIFALRAELDKPFDWSMLKTHRGIGYQLISEK
ncbi:MAG: response regulator transcription factor [Verrucomicrobiota bacterium]